MKRKTIERVFLIPARVPSPSAATIRMACVSRGQGREVWIHQSPNSCVLEIHSGFPQHEDIRRIELPPSEFEHLWNSCAAHRVEVQRDTTELQGQPLTIDSFAGTGVSLARVVSHGSVQARRFRKPADWKAEIPDGASLRDIALHGLPNPGDQEIQAGAVPFLMKKGILHIVLITNSSGTRWIIPKGRLESHLTPQEVALMEAAEEAGAIGSIEPLPLAPCRTEDGRLLRLYPLRVATLLPQWPERFQRRRVVLPIYRAILRLGDQGLVRSLRELSRLVIH